MLRNCILICSYTCTRVKDMANTDGATKREEPELKLYALKSQVVRSSSTILTSSWGRVGERLAYCGKERLGVYTS